MSKRKDGPEFYRGWNFGARDALDEISAWINNRDHAGLSAETLREQFNDQVQWLRDLWKLKD